MLCPQSDSFTLPDRWTAKSWGPWSIRGPADFCACCGDPMKMPFCMSPSCLCRRLNPLTHSFKESLTSRQCWGTVPLFHSLNLLVTHSSAPLSKGRLDDVLHLIALQWQFTRRLPHSCSIHGALSCPHPISEWNLTQTARLFPPNSQGTYYLSFLCRCGLT